MTTVKIYHNPACATSRNTLALIQNTGIVPEVILYLETPPTEAQLTQMIQDAGLSVRQAMRCNVAPFEQLGLAEDRFSDAELIRCMVQYPLLINRPFVVTEMGTCLARPSERVLDILSLPQQGAFSKEDGEQIVDANGQRLK
jgi:arsenate reductase